MNEMLKMSLVCRTKQEKQFLFHTMKWRAFKTTKLYRGSEDGFMGEDFHRLCDEKGPTLSLYKFEGQCIGGFTNAKWSAPD